MNAKYIHRATAVVLGLFIVSHLIVHLFALGGISAHQKALKSVQWIYRNPVGETILVLAILTQIVTGLKRLKVKRKSRNPWAKMQVYSGLYLIFFLIVHTGAAIYTHTFFGLETDIYWAAGTMKIWPIKFFFWPYYFLAVTAIFVHFACAIHFSRIAKLRRLKILMIWLGVALALIIVLTFSGVFFDIPISDDVAAYFQKYFPGAR